MNLVEQLRQKARGAAEAAQMLARAKSERNQAAGDVGANYEGGTPEQMIEWKAADEIDRLRQLVKDHEAVHEDHKRLVRELDVTLNGKHGAAAQASLCDIVSQMQSMRREALSQTSS